jgi:hypothetical protein
LSDPQPVSEDQPFEVRLHVLDKLQPLLLRRNLKDPGIVDDVGDGKGSLFEDEFSGFNLADVL